MELVRVDSSMLHAVGYDAETEELEAVFASGQIWRYTGVPRRVYEELLAASSKGQYMNANVIDVYPEYRLSRGGRR
jgi:hypothetical protein